MQATIVTLSIDLLCKQCYKASMLHLGASSWKNSPIYWLVLNSESAPTRTGCKSSKRNVVVWTTKSPLIKKYLELAETLYRVEADKAKLASLSSQFYSDEKGARQRPNTDVTDQSREILMGRSKYSGKSVSEAAYEMLREANRSMHAKELVQRLVEGGSRSRGKRR